MTTTDKLPALADIFSEYRTRGISGWEDLPKLGFLNLQELMRSLRASEKNLAAAIQKEYALADMFIGRDGAYFKERAKDYDNPEVVMGPPGYGSWSHDPEPCDAASIARDSRATSFNMCGWCEHTGSGSCRYSYHITTRCGLLPQPKYDKSVEKGTPTGREGRTDSPCQLHELTVEECNKVAQWRKGLAEGRTRARESVRVALKHVKALMDDAQVDKPYTTELRPCAWFDRGDEIVFYLRCFEADMLVDNAWGKALVIPGYRHHDGCVSCCFEVPIHTGDNLNGRGGGGSASSEYVLKKWEYDYLKDAVENDSEFLKIWLDCVEESFSNRERTFNREQFVEDLRSGTVAQKAV